MKLLSIIVLLFSLPAAGQQNGKPALGTYEFIKEDFGDNVPLRYQLRPLFVKEDTGWRIAETLKRNETVYLVYKGAVLKKMTTAGKFTGLPVHGDYTAVYKPYAKVSLSHKYFSLPFTGADIGIKRATLFTNRPSCGYAKWSNYVPTPEEKRTILDSFKVYLQNLYTPNCGRFLSVEGGKEDSVFSQILNRSADDLRVISNACFTDIHQNKIVTVVYPVPFTQGNVYPFNEDCFREDNGNEGYRISYYIDNSGKLTFLHEGLRYIDHVDVDRDGDDEFLFFYSIFNHEGFVLYSDNFTRSVEYLWSYH